MDVEIRCEVHPFIDVYVISDIDRNDDIWLDSGWSHETSRLALELFQTCFRVTRCPTLIVNGRVVEEAKVGGADGKIKSSREGRIVVTPIDGDE